MVITERKVLFLFKDTKHCSQGTLGIFCDAIFIYSRILLNHKKVIFRGKYLFTSKHELVTNIFFPQMFSFKSCFRIWDMLGESTLWALLTMYKLLDMIIGLFWWVRLCQAWTWVRETKRNNWGGFSVAKAVMTLVLVSLGGMNPVTGMLG